MWKRITVGLLLVALCGCIKTKDELTINADGSGTVRIETRTSVPPELTEGMQGQLGGMGGGAIYPPVSEAEARKFFPGKDFTISVTQHKEDNGELTTVIEVQFKDVNSLLASPYGHAHQLSATIAGGSLVVKGVTGMEATARLAEIKTDGGMGMAIPGIDDLQKKKGEMRAEFDLTLPNELATANGSHAGKTSTWVVERANCKDAGDFARQLGVVSEASCPAVGVTFKPITPKRMGMLPFAELAADAGMDSGTSVDTNKIAAIAKFVPYGLSVTRSLDLSGSGSVPDSSAELIGAIVMPQELAPPKWGEPKLDEVVDAKGNNLKPADDGQDRRFRQYGSRAENGDEEDNPTNNVQRHVININFHSPDWKVNEISRIKGSIDLQYLGGSQMVKLTNAIPAKWIVDPTKAMGGMAFDQSEKPLNSPALTGMGLKVALQMGMIQSGFTMLTLQATGKETVLTDAQVFDAEGTPWPTFLNSQDYGSGNASVYQIMVAGTPQPPLSLALVASGGGATVTVPFLMEHVSLKK